MMSTASNTSLKQSCSALTSVTGALEDIEVINVMRSINPRFTYLLTYQAHPTKEEDPQKYLSDEAY